MRIVLYGHAAYRSMDGEITIPKDTTLTLYAPSGGLLAKDVADALANGEKIEQSDLEAIANVTFFFNHKMDIPEERHDLSLDSYPITLKAGDKVPNFFLLHAPLPEAKEALRPVNMPSQTINVQKTTFLGDLLKEHTGHDIHWAACSLAKNPDAHSIGYGYGYHFRKNSPFYKQYTPPELTYEEKIKKRQERFGISDSRSQASSNDSLPSLSRRPSLGRSRQTLFAAQQVSNHTSGTKIEKQHRRGPYQY